MRLYDFKCIDCGQQFEKLVKTQYGVECPKCGSTKTETQISAPSIKVNGQGAYTNRMKV